MKRLLLTGLFLLLGTSVFSAISYVTYARFYSSSESSKTVTYSVASKGTTLIFTSLIKQSTSSVQSVTVDGVAMQYVRSSPIYDNSHVELWQLTDVSKGTKTIVVTFTSATAHISSIMSYTGTLGIEKSVSMSSESGNQTLTYTTTYKNSVITGMLGATGSSLSEALVKKPVLATGYNITTRWQYKLSGSQAAASGMDVSALATPMPVRLIPGIKGSFIHSSHLVIGELMDSAEVTRTITPTITRTMTQTVTETVTPTNTQTVTETITQTTTQTVTQTITQTTTETVTPTNTQTVTETNTQTVTPTNTQTVTETNTQTVTPTNTQTVTETNTQTVTPTNTLTSTPTATTTITPLSGISKRNRGCSKSVYIQFKRVPLTHHYRLYVNNSRRYITIWNNDSQISTPTRFIYRLCWDGTLRNLNLVSVGPNGILPVPYTSGNLNKEQ